MIGTIEAALITIIAAATPILLAATGELVVERSGTLNLGVEGLMLMGAIAGFIVAVSPIAALPVGWSFALIAAALAGAALSMMFAFLVLTLRTNQVASGLALTIFGIGFSSLLGANYTGIPVERLPRLDIPLLSEIPLIGRALFAQDALVYLSFLAIAGVSWFLYRTRAGLILRAIGENHDSAHAIGHPVILVRYAAIAFGGAMAGLGGAYLSLAKTPHWAENMTAGRGWIALALIVFATWRPGRLFFGAYLFGALAILELYGQISGISDWIAGLSSLPVLAQMLDFLGSTNFLTMMPYLVTVLVLVIISRDLDMLRRNAPGSIGKTFAPAR